MSLPVDADNAPEEQLIEQSRGGDLSAFNVLVERYQRSVFNLSLRMLGAEQPAEDATQEAFLAAYRSLKSFRGGSFRSWLMRIATNACYDEMRRRKSRPASSLDAAAGDDERAYDVADPDASLEGRAEQIGLRDALIRALDALPADQRLVIVLCDVQGLDYAEIAAVTGASLGTVKSRINRARGKLREILLASGELLPGALRQSSKEPN
jgi:RNA polymerase sigma-70 factor (ECF subfamily)